MSTPHKARWSLAEFLAWEADQPERWELVAGEPRMMPGGTGCSEGPEDMELM